MRARERECGSTGSRGEDGGQQVIVAAAVAYCVPGAARMRRARANAGQLSLRRIAANSRSPRLEAAVQPRGHRQQVSIVIAWR